MVLGEDQVQGLDYTYTLQGWLKGLNHPALAADPGQDGTGSSKVGRDAFGMSLGYYAGDYQRTGHALSSEILGANHAPATGKSLYNGNIAAWSSGHFYQVAGAARQTVAAERFSYDELNRLKASSYTELGATRNAQAFATGYSYDAIGNLTADVQSNISSISWSPYGKPLQISKTNSSTVKFGYDASGNRVSKEQGNRTTYFVRDTSGNTMATYVKEPVDNATPELCLTEQPIYGSTRIGQRQVSLPLGAGPLALLQNLLGNHF
jgi:YD repeat-containing protein